MGNIFGIKVSNVLPSKGGNEAVEMVFEIDVEAGEAGHDSGEDGWVVMLIDSVVSSMINGVLTEEGGRYAMCKG